MSKIDKGLPKISAEANELIDQLMSHWSLWDKHESYYLDTLAPNLIQNIHERNPTEKLLFDKLEEIIDDQEWLSIPDIIREKRRLKCLDTLKKIETKEKIKQDRKIAQKERIHAKKRRQDRLAQQALEERQRQQRKKDFVKRVWQGFKKDFQAADDFFEKSHEDQLTSEEYEQEKVRFIQFWFKKTANTRVDKEQALAIATHGINIQVIARAGSGKTSTLVNRAFFLQKHCGVNTEHMILLAFNKKAAKEMSKRLTTMLGKKTPHVMTFHALAYALVKTEEKILYDDPDNLSSTKSRQIQSIIDEYIRDDRYQEQIKSLMLNHFRNGWDNICQSGRLLDKDNLLKYRRKLPNFSLKGERVNSSEEKLIADFLFEHDISYTYKKSYTYKQTSWKKQDSYQLDFSLKNDDIIVEYFDIPNTNDFKNLSSVKKRLWTENYPEVIKISPQEISSGRTQFFPLLKRLLEDKGIVCIPLSEEEIWIRIKDRAIDQFTQTMTGFIERCRQQSLTAKQLSQQIETHQSLFDAEEQFLKITPLLYGRYLTHIQDTSQEDFDGLIQKATIQIQEGNTRFNRMNKQADLKNCRYLFIDEYQDFSSLFMNLVAAIRQKNTKMECFCVGDDWQAINGFAGSDLQFYSNFQQFFSPSQILHISTNYRSAPEIVSLGNALMKNRGKEAVAYKTKSGSIMLGDLTNIQPSSREKERHGAWDKITPAVLRLIPALLQQNKRIVLLSRTNNLPWPINYKNSTSSKQKGLEAYRELICSFVPKQWEDHISISTVHKYKGRENDAVIILDAILSRYPLIHPNWIFNRIFGDSLNSIIEEETRLFYVALTRAIDTLIILADREKKASLFLKNILNKQPTEKINWENFPPIQNLLGHLTVQLSSLIHSPEEGTFPIKEFLKKDGYTWDPTNYVWHQGFEQEKYSLKTLQHKMWSTQAINIRARIIDHNDTCIGHYIINSGHWHSISAQ
jgi:DNA helicase IV